MSVLSLPRVNFHGEVYWNPNTANNFEGIYDEDKGLPVKPEGLPWDQYIDWLTDLVDSQDEKKKTIRGGWDVYGDHSTTFEGVKVVSAVGSDGKVASGDRLLGQPLTLYGEAFVEGYTNGRLVDVDPYGSTSSQIFFDKMIIGDGEVGVTGLRSVRMYSRWIGVRNLAKPRLDIAGPIGVIWQCGLPKDSLDWSTKAESSPVLKALRTAIESDPDSQGLVLRFATYRTLYYQTASDSKGKRLDSPEKLSMAYKDGFKGANPAVSLLTGSLGVWGKDELSSGPTDRLLVPITDPPFKATVLVGPASARLEAERNAVAVDAVALVPEVNPECDKLDVGTLSLQVEPADGGQPVTIGQPVDFAGYDREAYRDSGGVLAFDLGDVAAETVAAGRLSLVSGKYGPVVQEKTLHADTDERARYIDEGEQAAITVKVFERGQPVADDRAKLLVMQYDKNWSSGDPIAVDPGGQPIDKRVLEVKDGRAWLDVKVHKPGVCYLAYTAYPANQSPPAVQPDPQSQGYTAVRGLPFDNLLEQHTGDDELSWKFLYERVLRTWDKVYPVMSVVRDLHKKTVFDGMTEQTRFAISPERFETCWYMPITRDLSAGKRKLILRYLNLLPNRVPPDSVTPDTAVAELPGARTEG